MESKRAATPIVPTIVILNLLHIEDHLLQGLPIAESQPTVENAVYVGIRVIGAVPDPLN